MPSSSPPVGRKATEVLCRLGKSLRERRKQLGLSSTVTAEAAGMSRVTLLRVERGEPSVTMGAYVSVIEVLGLELELVDEHRRGEAPKLPRAIRLADYPQLKKLAWQLRKKQALTPADALALYDRNWRHLELSELTEREKELIRQLLHAFGRERLLV